MLFHIDRLIGWRAVEKQTMDGTISFHSPARFASAVEGDVPQDGAARTDGVRSM